MDDERAFGRTVFRLGYADAIARGVVAPLKLVFVDASDSYARHMAKQAASGKGGRVPVDAEDSGAVMVLLVVKFH